VKARKELLAEIETTIDQLIKNEEILSQISSDSHYEVEIAALEKTQESLLFHLIHLQTHLQAKEDSCRKGPSIEPPLSSPHLYHGKLRKKPRELK
jgi:hypothetical protein